MTEAEKAYQYFVIAVPENEEQAKAYFWARKALSPTLTPPNKPLTPEQLREMDGEPVWLDVADGVWALVDTDDDCVWLDRGGSIDIFRLAGKAYRHPPEGEEKHNG